MTINMIAVSIWGVNSLKINDKHVQVLIRLLYQKLHCGLSETFRVHCVFKDSTIVISHVRPFHFLCISALTGWCRVTLKQLSIELIPRPWMSTCENRCGSENKTKLLRPVFSYWEELIACVFKSLSLLAMILGLAPAERVGQWEVGGFQH